MGVDIDEWQGLVTVGVISSDAPAVGKLEVGDVIEGVGGKDCHNDMNEVIRAIIESPEVVVLQIRRPLPVTVLRSTMAIRAQSEGEWLEMTVSLLQSRLLAFESDEGPAGEINLRSVVQLELGESHNSRLHSTIAERERDRRGAPGSSGLLSQAFGRL